VALPQIAEGSEHRVFLDVANARVFKATRPGLFGESYYIQDNEVFQRNCRPLEYLSRLLLWKSVFGSAPEAHGITALGQIVTSHEFITGNLPSQDEVMEKSLSTESSFKPATYYRARRRS
jgi:hypothetical protein